MKAPEPTKLFNIEQWYQPPPLLVCNGICDGFGGSALKCGCGQGEEYKQTPQLKATIAYGKPYALAKSIKRQEELKNQPNGTYFKIVKH